MLEDENNVLARIGPGDLVLDVGGWACPFNRADWVVDAEPFETRGYYASIGLPGSQGGSQERFKSETWIRRDLCAREPWPFADKQFDFSICSHTLEDLRDPLFVCSELIRVSKAGYIEVPSRLWESCRGVEHPRIAGLSHHRWLVERTGNHLQFTQKYHRIHAAFDLSLPSSFLRRLSKENSIVRFYWQGGFTFAETTLHGADNIHAFLSDYAAKHVTYSHGRYWARSGARAFQRLLARLRRHVA
jgi:ubiquinone/menaquinone biosynthesis C-methylase UbiE